MPPPKVVQPLATTRAKIGGSSIRNRCSCRQRVAPSALKNDDIKNSHFMPPSAFPVVPAILPVLPASKRDRLGHCGRDSQRLLDAAKIVIRMTDRNHLAVILKFL